MTVAMKTPFMGAVDHEETLSKASADLGGICATASSAIQGMGNMQLEAHLALMESTPKYVSGWLTSSAGHV